MIGAASSSCCLGGIWLRVSPVGRARRKREPPILLVTGAPRIHPRERAINAFDFID